MNTIPAQNSNTGENKDTKQQVQCIGRRSEATSTGTDTPFTAPTSAAVVSMEVPMPRPSTGTATTFESCDIINAHSIDDSDQKKSGHHFYYVPTSTAPEHDDFGRTELPRTSSNDSNDQQHQSLQLQHYSNFILQQHDQPLTSTFPSSPMVTPPVHRGYVNGTNRRDLSTATSNITASTHQHQSMMFHQTSHQPQQPQQHSMFTNQGAGAVPHVYHDYIGQGAWNDMDDENASTFIRKKTGGVSQPFPEKLHEMLTTVENTDEKDIVTWLPHGRAFIVRKPKEFTDFIMPKYFKQTKLTSFQRQLNLYGFRRLTQGSDAGAYYHELFLRVRPSLCQRMTRQKVKGTGHKQPADAKTEPNFYEMSLSSMPQVPRTATTTKSLNSNSVSCAHPSTSNPPTTQHVKHELHSSDYLNESDGRSQPQQIQQVYGGHEGSERHAMSVDAYGSRLTRIPADAVLDSPGLQCAAHLLQGIASGFIHNNLHIPTSDALTTAGGVEDGTEKEVVSFERSSDDNSNRRSTTFLQPRLSNEYR